jgi:hypothetical protein
MISLKLIAERDVPEWSLIELQGTLSLPEDWGDQDAVELGTMLRSVEVRSSPDCIVMLHNWYKSSCDRFNIAIRNGGSESIQ